LTGLLTALVIIGNRSFLVRRMDPVDVASTIHGNGERLVVEPDGTLDAYRVFVDNRDLAESDGSG
jgi:hypothetical protein